MLGNVKVAVVSCPLNNNIMQLQDKIYILSNLLQLTKIKYSNDSVLNQQFTVSIWTLEQQQELTAKLFELTKLI